jgi:FAD/FMN-containing dehydrogenase/Fe-S oxidoreductase
MTDAAALEATLRDAVRGAVRFDRGARATWSTDASNFRQVPLGVVLPRDVGDVVAAVEACRQHGAPITMRGGGTSLAGQATNAGVIIDTSTYLNQIVEVDAAERTARVQPGVVLDALQHRAGSHGLAFGPDPATHDRCTLGGMIGNNSCGVHSVIGGRTSDNVESLDVLLYEGIRLTVGPTSRGELETIIAAGGRRGEIYGALRTLRDRYADRLRQRFPRIPRRVSGYNLDELLPENGFNVARALAGTEGTCVTVLEAVVRLIAFPAHRALVVIGYRDLGDAGDHVPEILHHDPVALEGMDGALFTPLSHQRRHGQELSMLPEGRAFLVVELGGDDSSELGERVRSLVASLDDWGTSRARVFEDARARSQIWAVREEAVGAIARLPGGDFWPGWEDSAVPPERVGPYLTDLRRLCRDHEYEVAIYGHFGQGCVHARITFDLASTAGVDHYRLFLDEAADLVVSHGGSLSGEHGDGQQRGVLLEKMFGADLVDAFRQFKAIWDPDSRMNPGKVVDSGTTSGRLRGPTNDLRLGAGWAPKAPLTHFRLSADGGRLDRALLRCEGVGKCRREEGGVMCPSYMVTRAEEHSTRGRARLLFEMLRGEVVTDGWRSREVFDALDLCLSCKGCKSECPVGVDMATYKSEFLSHYYEGQVRPRSAYAMGLIMYGARIGSGASRLVNVATRTPALADAVKRVAGVAPQRAVPRLAEESFRRWFARRPRPAWKPGRRPVLLLPDTFSNFFQPEVDRAVVTVLEAAGFEVLVPPRVVCCGRPLYDYGMLATARRLHAQLLDVLRPMIRAGVPIVVAEPSCCASIRDELGELAPDDADVTRLARQTHTLGELLQLHAPDWELPDGGGGALVQGHCHQRAVMGIDDDTALLDRMGVAWDTPDSGCCGLAGSWGFEAEKYDLSMALGERVLFPAVRDADPATVVIADGFSCRTQVEHGTGRRAVHLAQLIERRLVGSGEGGAGGE